MLAQKTCSVIFRKKEHLETEHFIESVIRRVDIRKKLS